MGEISPGWRQKMREACKKCTDIFISQQSLYQLFGTSELYAWQEYLPEATSLGQRIDNTLDYLSDKENALGESALVLFLQVLSTRYSSQDKRHSLLMSSMRALQTQRPHTREKKAQEVFIQAAFQQSTRLTIHEIESIRHRAHSVALIKARRFLNGTVEYDETGTGWLIAPGLLLTCWHVVATLMDSTDTPPEAIDMQHQLDDMLVFFDKTESSGGIDYRIEKMEYSAPQQDFALLRLVDRTHDPYTNFGYLAIERDAPLTTQTQLFIIQHPWGEPQQVTLGGSFAGHTTLPGRICYTTETQPGTSGAPVLRHQNGCVVALHNGKIGEETPLPEGTRIDAILDILQEQAPALHREIMQAQAKLNGAFAQTSSLKQPVATTTARSEPQPRTTFPPIASSMQSSKQPDQPNPEPERRVPHYTYAETYPSDAPVLCVAFDLTGKSFLYGKVTDGINRVDTVTLRRTSMVKTCTNAVTSLAFSADGKYLGSGGDDGTVTVWDATQPQLGRYKTFQAHTDWVSGLAFHSDGCQILSGSDDGSIKLLSISARSGRTLNKRSPTGIAAIAAHPQQDLIASYSANEISIVRNPGSGNSVHVSVLSGGGNCLLFHPDGRFLVGGNTEGALVVYDTRNWAATSLPPLHTRAIRCLAFHPEGSLLASGGDDQVVHLWNISTGEHVQKLPGHTHRFTSLTFSPDGHYLLASAGQDAKIIVWKSL